MDSKRVRMNFSLSSACVYRLRELARTHDRPMSHVVEDLILNKGSTLEALSSPGGGEAELMARVDGVLGHIDKLKEKYGIEY